MAHTFEELKKKTVAELREIAKDVDHEAVQGYSQLNKEHLLKALCTAMHIDMHGHHEIVGLNKTEVKSKIRELMKKRDSAIAAKDHAVLTVVRKRIHGLKKKLRRAAV
jgi:DNA-binding IclR family transcriptional regulator